MQGGGSSIQQSKPAMQSITKRLHVGFLADSKTLVNTNINNVNLMNYSLISL